MSDSSCHPDEGTTHVSVSIGTSVHRRSQSADVCLQVDLESGLTRCLVFHPQLDLLLMHTQKFAAAIAHGVSSKKRIEIIARAKVLGVK